MEGGREGRKQGMQMEVKKTGRKGKERGGVTHIKEGRDEGRGRERQRETVEEMAGGKRVQKCNSRLHTVQKAVRVKQDKITP